jgi:hypothetical protein
MRLAVSTKRNDMMNPNQHVLSFKGSFFKRGGTWWHQTSWLPNIQQGTGEEHQTPIQL